MIQLFLQREHALMSQLLYRYFKPVANSLPDPEDPLSQTLHYAGDDCKRCFDNSNTHNNLKFAIFKILILRIANFASSVKISTSKITHHMVINKYRIAQKFDEFDEWLAQFIKVFRANIFLLMFLL